MTGEARLIAFEIWMNAALRGAGWLEPLRRTAALLDARAVAIIWSDAEDGRTFLNVGPEAPPEFVRLCGVLSKSHGTGVFERHEPDLGRVVWTKVRSDVAPAAGELLFAAVFERSVDQALFREIAAVAVSSVTTKARLASVRATSALKTEAFEQLPFGIVIVDRNGRVAEPNEACRRILSRADGLSVVKDKLLCSEPRDQAAIYKAINRALAGDASANVLKVRRRRGAQPYVVRVVAPRASGSAPANCLLMIVDPDEEPSPCGDIWRAMFDLTDCEVIIAEGLVLGRRIHDIASQRGVSIETVRTQTKRMFERLNVSSQAEAAVRLSRTAPFRLAQVEHRDLAEAEEV